jgi:hypothetical protein
MESKALLALAMVTTFFYLSSLVSRDNNWFSIMATTIPKCTLPETLNPPVAITTGACQWCSENPPAQEE